MDTVKRDFNGAAHFFLGLSMFAVIMAIITNAMNISNYKFFGFGNTDTLIIEIVCDALILIAGILTFMKKPYGLIALVLLFIIRMFATVDYSSSLSVAGQLGGKTAFLIRDFCLFAIAMCFKKNGISGWKSMLASEEYVIAHTTVAESVDEPIDEQTGKESSHNTQDEEQYMPKEESDILQPATVENVQDQGAGIASHVVEKPQVAELPVSEERVEDDKKTSIRDRAPLSKLAKICIASVIGIIVICAGIAIVVATKSYPDYISSFGDKWKYTFNLPNDRLVKELVERAQPKGSDLYYVLMHPKYTSSVFSAEDFYEVRVDILREQSGSSFYVSTKEVKKPQDLEDDKIYVSIEDGELDVLEGQEDISETRNYWNENNSLDGEKIYATKKYDCDIEIKKEMALIDQAASLPVRDISVVDMVGGYYENEANYSKATDYYKFLLSKYPKSSAIRGRLSYALILGGNNTEAREAAEKALSRDPKEVTALKALALIEAEEYNWGEAKKYARKAIDYGSEDSNVYYAYCEALYKQGEIKAAQLYYNKGYESYRHNPRREKYSEYAGCPFDIHSFHYGSTLNSKIIIPKDGKLVSSKCYYIGFVLDVNVLRWETVTIGIKLYRDGKLVTGSESRDGYTYYDVVNGRKPGEGSISISGWGNETGRYWPAGRHRIEIWYNGNKIAEDTFRVY